MEIREWFNYPWEVFDKPFQVVMWWELVVIVWESNSWKTTFAMEMIERNVKRGKKCFYMNFEFSIETMWTNRWLWEKWKDKETLTDCNPLTEEEQEDLDNYVKDKLLQFDYYNNPNWETIDNILTKINEQSALGYSFFVIDSFSRIVGNSNADSVWKNQNTTMAKLQEIAQRLEVCIVVLHHTNKNGKFEGSQKIMDLANVMVTILKESDSDGDWYRRYILSKDKYVSCKELELYYKNWVYSLTDC